MTAQEARRAGHRLPGQFERFREDVRRIVPLAWPVVVGQVASLAFLTIDTLVLARRGATDVAALALGGAAVTIVFVGFMATLAALGPIAGRAFGAGRLPEVGHQTWQAAWLAFAFSAVGVLLLAFPGAFLALADPSPEVANKARLYLAAQSLALPAGLQFVVYRSLNQAISRPKAVMALQLVGLALKLPLTWMLVEGVPALGIPAFGVVGCGLATALVQWCQAGLGWHRLLRHPTYQAFELRRPGAARLDLQAMRSLLRLGVPMGASTLVEVSAFSLMAVAVARLGATAVAGHQIMVNIVALLFMVQLALGNATTTLVAQRIGALDMRDARRLGLHGVLLALLVGAALAGAVALGRGPLVALYTHDAAVAAVTVGLLAWVLPFHVADALQAVAGYVLRAWHVVTLPTLVHVLASWGIGLGGGWWLAYGGNRPWAAGGALAGTQAFWQASTAGLLTAGVALCVLLQVVSKRRVRETSKAA